MDMERRTAGISPQRGLNYLKSKLAPLIEGPTGLAADCSRIICNYAEQHPDKGNRTLALIGRAGALYPFFRSSALLRHLDGHTHNVPVVLLYPGERRGATGLSFMGILNPDNDYRPRILSMTSLPRLHDGVDTGRASQRSLRRFAWRRGDPSRNARDASGTPTRPPRDRKRNSMKATAIRELFVADVTRDIPPVVYFHEQSPREARRRSLRVHHHRRLAREATRITAACTNGIHEQFVHLLRAMPPSWTSQAAPSSRVLDLRLLRLRQVELRQAARPGPRRRRTARRQARWPRRCSNATPRPAPTSCATRGTRCARRSIRSPWSSTSAASRGTTSTSTPPRCARSSGVSATAAPSPWWPTSSSSSSGTASGSEFLEVAAKVLGKPWSAAKDEAQAEDHFSHVLHVM